jgi:metallo-beta-lactamase class B
MNALHSRSIALACAACGGAAVVGATFVVAASTRQSGAARQSGAGSVESHIEAARRAAGTEYLPVFNGLCGPLTPAPAAAAAREPAPAAPSAASAPSRPSTYPPPPSEWHVDPVKVFDNLYFLGQSEYTAWAVTTSAGIIVIDPLFEYSVEDEVVNGLTKLGLDPRQIKYVLVSHGHRDHVGGAQLLQQRFGAHVVMSAADWDLVLGSKQSYPTPKRDMVAADGQKLTLGDTSITMYFTPGHTPGTISSLIPVKDQGRPHLAALWGGTGFNFTITPDHAKPYWFETYARSASHFAEAVAKSDADVHIANHPNQDGATAKLAALAGRKPGAPHPFVVGNATILRYLTMVRECAQAGLATSR